MKILIDINHPAHVHYFKNCIRILRKNGHQITISSRNRYPAQELLDALGEDYYDRGPGSDSLLGKFFYLVLADIRLLKLSLKIRPDLFLSFGTPYPNHIAWLMQKPGINFQDTESARLMNLLSYPFSSAYFTPRCYLKKLGKKHFYFNGYMELCYLHPKYFTPNSSVLKYLDVAPNEPYIIFRFVNWKASHDIRLNGLTIEMKRRALVELSKYARVFISSEIPLPADLIPLQIHIPPEKMHDALAYASLYYGESATMASESAVLGTPAIYIDDIGRGYTYDQEMRYGLVFNFRTTIEDFNNSLTVAANLLMTNDLKIQSTNKRYSLLKETIDVTNFMCSVIENYPMSLTMFNDNSEFLL